MDPTDLLIGCSSRQTMRHRCLPLLLQPEQLQPLLQRVLPRALCLLLLQQRLLQALAAVLLTWRLPRQARCSAC
jgi:hypothetical protein